MSSSAAKRNSLAMVEDQRPSKPIYQPDEVLEALAKQPEPRNYNCERLLQAHHLQKGMIQTLKSGVSTLDAADAFLLKYLRSLYLEVSALPGSVRYNQLELSVMANGHFMPFIAGIDLTTKRMEIGLPTKADVKCDKLSELVRVAGAAYCCKWHYLNFPHIKDAVPSDDAALLFTSLAINSLADKDIAERFNQRAKELMAAEAGGSDGEDGEVLTAEQLRWLMHWVRAELVGWFAGVQFLLGDEGCEASWVAQQQDYLHLLKQSPSDPVAYALYARACLRFQQTRPAFIFATKGITVAEARNEQLAKAQMHALRGVAMLLGGGGDKYKPSEVAACLREARKAHADALAWLPAPYHDLFSLHPEDTIIMDKVLGLRAPVKEEGEKGKEAEEGREGEEEAVEPEFDDETVNQAMEKALKEDAEIDVPPAMYVAPPPTELPIGALTQLKQQADEQRMVQAMEANSIAEAGAAKEAGAGEAAGSQPRKQVKVKGGKRGRKGAK